MRCSSVLIALAFVVCVVSLEAKQQLPEKFLGSWDVEKSDNFDEYLEAKGYGWFMRQMVKMASITKIFTHKGNGQYNCKIQTTKKNVEWDNWELAKEFQGEYLDDSQHKITITYDPIKDIMSEKHTVVGEEEKPADLYTYNIDKDGYLVMHMEYNGVATNRFYKQSGGAPAAGGQ